MSKKIYKGYELIKAMANGEINYGTKFKIKDWNEIVVYEQSNLIFREILGTGEEGNNYGKTIFDLWNLDYILSANFELIEEDTIDIESIEELNELSDCEERNMKINEIIRAVKQLNKEIKSIKEK